MHCRLLWNSYLEMHIWILYNTSCVWEQEMKNEFSFRYLILCAVLHWGHVYADYLEETQVSGENCGEIAP